MGYFKKKQSPEYRTNIEKSLTITLFIIIIIFILFPTFNFEYNEEKVVHLNIIVEDIPITKQGAYRPPPSKPAVPIPAEDESIPEDETIEVTNLDFKLSLPASPGGYEGFGVSSYVPPRPIAEVIPEYPKEDYKNGVTGVVKLHININSQGNVIEVIVLENTTNSELCAESAQKAASQCLYIPARSGNSHVSCWTTRLITFSIPKN